MSSQDDPDRPNPRVSVDPETATRLTEELVPDAVSLPEAIRTAMRRGIEVMDCDSCGGGCEECGRRDD